MAISKTLGVLPRSGWELKCVQQKCVQYLVIFGICLNRYDQLEVFLYEYKKQKIPDGK